MLRLASATVSAVVLALATAPLAQPAQAQSAPVQMRVDTGTFRYDGVQMLAELYVSVGAASLVYTRTAAGAFEAALPVRFTVRPVSASAPAGAASAPAFEQSLGLRFSVADTSALQAGQVFTEQVRAALAPGEYQVEVAATAGGANVRADVDLTVPDYTAAAGPMLSSIQLARRIVRATDPAAPFVKSGYVVQPYPDAFFGGDLRRVTYYAEVYGLPEGGTYTLLSYLSASSRPTAVAGTETRTTRAARPVDVVTGAVDVSALPTGEYTLHLAVLGAANEAVAERTKRLFVINPDVAQPAAALAVVEDDEILYLAMAEEELALNVAHAGIVATSAERGQIAALRTDDERRAFLVRFWRARDTATAGTDARRTFYGRLERVNNLYRQGSTPGYRTDQGRIYLTYGSPSNFDRQAFNSDTAPFEVWTYDAIPGEGRSTFVFVDRFNSGEMVLVNSDVTGEISRPDWQQELLDN